MSNINNNENLPVQQIEDDGEDFSAFSFQSLIAMLILNWHWFVISALICLGGAKLYLRYQVPVYNNTAKLFVKSGGGRSSLSISGGLSGVVSNFEGMSNEMELLKCHSIALNTVRSLKLYTNYSYEGRFVDRVLYKNQPVTVELDAQSVESLQAPINMKIDYEDGRYHVTGSYTRFHPENGPEARSIDAVLPVLPARIRTGVGYLTFLPNGSNISSLNGERALKVSITPPSQMAAGYAGRLGVSNLGSTSILILSFADAESARAQDYLREIVVSYNEEANEDKNLVAARTEEFINNRLEKINVELGVSEGKLEDFKRQNRVIDPHSVATRAYGQTTNYEQQFADMDIQLQLFNSLSEYMNNPANKYQTMPTNIGITDNATTNLIAQYNTTVFERNRMLRTANENSPSVIPLTEQLNDLANSIRRAMTQARQSYDIKRNAMMSRYSKFSAEVDQSPAQERMLNEIGRQHEVRSGLYLMLLKKREENSISLAATADKGKLIDAPAFAGQISPNEKSIMGTALGAGLAIPFAILLILQLMRYKIEGHDDVARITKLPIIADIPVASDVAKSTADIVVHENENNLMEEVFRSLRTNMTFMMKEGQKVILFTSGMSGEGKTFVAANLAMSFALLNKRVVLVGLDIRRPRLAELFGVKNRSLGLSTLLTHDELSEDEVLQQIVASGINDNLDVLLAGPVPPNPAEIVTRPSLDRVFEVLRDNYDYVIIDTAPVGLVTDTLSISRVADSTIYVCRSEYTPKESIEQVNEYAQTNKLPNICIAINGIDLSLKKYGYYYGYGKYGKYGRYGRYGRYSRYGHYGRYRSSYSSYGNYSYSHYGDKKDNSIKR